MRINYDIRVALLIDFSFPRGKLGNFRITPGSILIWQSALGVGGCVHFPLILVIVSVVLVAHNFTKLDSGAADYDYLVFGEFSRFVYCLLQKVKRSSDLPVIEKWETYMLLNHSCFGTIAEDHFLEGTRLLSSLEK